MKYLVLSSFLLFYLQSFGGNNFTDIKPTSSLEALKDTRREKRIKKKRRRRCHRAARKSFAG